MGRFRIPDGLNLGRGSILDCCCSGRSFYLKDSSMDANELEKQVPGSKLMTYGAVFMFIGSIVTGGVFLFFVLWLLWTLLS